MNKQFLTKVIALGAVVASSFFGPASAFADGPAGSSFPTETVKFSYGYNHDQGPAAVALQYNPVPISRSLDK